MKYRRLTLAMAATTLLAVQTFGATYTTFTTTNASGGITTVTTTNTTSIWDDFKQLGADAAAAFSAFDLSQGVKVTPFGLAHFHDHTADVGGGLCVGTAQTNGVNYAFAVAALRDTTAPNGVTFYDTTINISFGHTFMLGSLPLYTYVETGPCTDLAHPTVLYEQTFSGAEFHFGSRYQWSVGAGVGQNSKWSGDICTVFHLSVVL